MLVNIDSQKIRKGRSKENDGGNFFNKISHNKPFTTAIKAAFNTFHKTRKGYISYRVRFLFCCQDDQNEFYKRKFLLPHCGEIRSIQFMFA
jgi:hypothetical protein